MDSELAAFLDTYAVDFADTIVWASGATRLKLQGFLGAQLPPDRFVLAGRAIVIRGKEVLVVETPHGNHILPGGRRENGETTVDAIHRELSEETGWIVENLRPFAVLHLHYETPMPKNVGQVIYPDFIWHVFTAEPLKHSEHDQLNDDREVVLGTSFRPIEEVLKMPLDPFQRELLAALTQRTAGGATRFGDA